MQYSIQTRTRERKEALHCAGALLNRNCRFASYLSHAADGLELKCNFSESTQSTKQENYLTVSAGLARLCLIPMLCMKKEAKDSGIWKSSNWKNPVMDGEVCSLGRRYWRSSETACRLSLVFPTSPRLEMFVEKSSAISHHIV
ncbi:hypothetical protein CDAR_210721 [Caerostris darwini]|uniref:Uncharacterized protein n=1 Tax=Caerostris darwini TaxID=1538125 RepID=A0AAV4VRZ0_9ARAC|nr:hypothetical protein CDAR_210721 [Caerostris darwini]